MEGYRAGLILCMPEFDTYHVIERFAKDHNDPGALQAYIFLKRRTELAIRWRAVNLDIEAPLNKLVELYTGTKEKAPKPTKLEDMSEQDRLAAYEQACKAAGIELDPTLFTK